MSNLSALMRARDVAQRRVDRAQLSLSQALSATAAADLRCSRLQQEHQRQLDVQSCFAADRWWHGWHQRHQLASAEMREAKALAAAARADLLALLARRKALDALIAARQMAMRKQAAKRAFAQLDDLLARKFV